MAANQAANRPADILIEPEGLHPVLVEDTTSEPVDLGIPNLTDVEEIGGGGGFRIYRAAQLVPHRLVTVKVLQESSTSSSGQRFDRERTVSGDLSGHSSVVPLYDTGTTADGRPYLLLPFYPRGSLARLVGEHGRLPWREASFLLEPIAVTLSEVHGRGLVHRNLSADSVLLTDFLMPRVADFSLSLAVGQRSTADVLVRSVFFSAPELAVPIEADPRADVYSLGALLFAMVTGQASFTGDRALLMARTATAQARTGTSANAQIALPDALRSLVARSMAEDPKARPANAAAFVSELRQAVARPNELSHPLPEAPTDLDLTSEPSVAAIATVNGDSNGSDESGAEPPAPGAQPASASNNGAGGGVATADPATGSERSAATSAAVTDARYVLLLAATITVVILIMVIAAMVAAS